VAGVSAASASFAVTGNGTVLVAARLGMGDGTAIAHPGTMAPDASKRRLALAIRCHHAPPLLLPSTVSQQSVRAVREGHRLSSVPGLRVSDAGRATRETYVERRRNTVLDDRILTREAGSVRRVWLSDVALWRQVIFFRLLGVDE